MLESIFPSSTILVSDLTILHKPYLDKTLMSYITFLLPLKKENANRATNSIPQVSPVIKVQSSVVTITIHDLLKVIIMNRFLLVFNQPNKILDNQNISYKHPQRVKTRLIVGYIIVIAKCLVVMPL